MFRGSGRAGEEERRGVECMLGMKLPQWYSPEPLDFGKYDMKRAIREV